MRQGQDFRFRDYREARFEILEVVSAPGPDHHRFLINHGRRIVRASDRVETVASKKPHRLLSFSK
jgi:hypothetical protein